VTAAQAPAPVPMNDLARSVAALLPELQSAAEEVLASGWYVQGPQHRAFEAELADYLGARHALGVASGTDALELAIRATAVGPGPVVAAANAGGYAATAALRSGRDVRLADVSPDTLSLTADTVAPVLDGAAAVVTTHLYGRLGEVEELASLCRDRGVPLVEDCAQAIGARRGGRSAGSFGTVGTLSFYPTKNLGALGDGGAVVTDDDEIAARVRRLRQYGWSSKYRITEAGGVNSRLDELQAALLRVRLPAVDAQNERRRAVIRRYAAAVEPHGRITVLQADDASHSGHLAVCLVEDREDAVHRLATLGVATDVHYPVPDHHQPAFQDRYPGLSLPVTEQAAASVLSLPCFPELREDEIDTVCRALGKISTRGGP
jgi:dTDP-3-amino-2,3,6-trideoxy-4-keto-D-glucose/dTDP-3-amino-3,4,6-trideoxy-alpha-D-glucose/dTDP-2,6-dideoxy-D-kanosamine transaminase